jgi:hypothetical protein
MLPASVVITKMQQGFLTPSKANKNRGNIKSLQSGTANFTISEQTLTVTITEVDTTASVLFFSYQRGGSSAGSSTPDKAMVKGVLTNSTTLTFTVGGTAYSPWIIDWQVVTFYNVKSLQRGSALAETPGLSLQQSTVTAVDPSRCLLIVSAESTDTAAGNTTSYAQFFRYGIVDATHIGFGTSLPSATFAYQLVEFR